MIYIYIWYIWYIYIYYIYIYTNAIYFVHVHIGFHVGSVERTTSRVGIRQFFCARTRRNARLTSWLCSPAWRRWCGMLISHRFNTDMFIVKRACWEFAGIFASSFWAPQVLLPVVVLLPGGLTSVPTAWKVQRETPGPSEQLSILVASGWPTAYLFTEISHRNAQAALATGTAPNKLLWAQWMWKPKRCNAAGMVFR